MIILFDPVRSFGRDAHGAVKEEGDTHLASQISRINPGDQWGDRCRNQIALTSSAKQKKRHRCTEQTFGLWEKARVGCFETTASKYIYYLGWNRSPAQAGCMRQVLGAGALGRPREIGWGGRWEGESEWGTHVNPWLIHVNVWQKPLQYCKVIRLQLIKINEKKKKKESTCQLRGHRKCRFHPWVGKIPWRRKWQLAPVFLPGKLYGQRSLAGYSPWGHRKSDTIEWRSICTI